ncbi:hypothetical protein LZ32DRAFT_313897 [Colletotrichum eremochloae]|nr:hypothetical protein LZ32DRAFT_313897 [Colletotrichum eremochloae]
MVLQEFMESTLRNSRLAGEGESPRASGRSPSSLVSRPRPDCLSRAGRNSGRIVYPKHNRAGLDRVLVRRASLFDGTQQRQHLRRRHGRKIMERQAGEGGGAATSYLLHCFGGRSKLDETATSALSCIVSKTRHTHVETGLRYHLINRQDKARQQKDSGKALSAHRVFAISPASIRCVTHMVGRWVGRFLRWRVSNLFLVAVCVYTKPDR